MYCILLSDSNLTTYVSSLLDLAGNVYYSVGGTPTPPTPATPSPSSTPTDSPTQCEGIVDIAVGNPEFSTLVAALTAADLVNALSGDGPLTVFGTYIMMCMKTVQIMYALTNHLMSILKYCDSPNERCIRCPP